MSVENKVPEIRFKGFSGEWESCRVGSITVFHKQGFYTTESYAPSKKYYLLRGTDLNNNKLLLNGTPKINATEKDYSDFKVEIGDVLLVRSGNVGTYGIVYESIEGIFGSYLINFRFDRSKVVNEFFGCFYQSERFFKQLRQIIQQSANTNINAENIKSVEISLTNLQEQTAIGNYFQNLDNLINQHQQKHDKLGNIKKAMLEKMFPKQGETIPEIRFKGFSGEWEEKELKKISDKITEKNTSVIYSETFTNSAEFGIVSQRDYFDKDISNSNNIGGYYVVQPEDFVYNPRISTFAPCGPIKRNSLGRAGVMSPLYTVFRTKGVNTIFIEYIFQTNLWHTFMFLNGDTGARADRFSIKDSVFFELPLLLPTVNEQTAIGNYFQKLDALINQHQQQITKLNNIKQACLSKMFV
jgi:type I restriction enzyme S subunit